MRRESLEVYLIFFVLLTPYHLRSSFYFPTLYFASVTGTDTGCGGISSG